MAAPVNYTTQIVASKTIGEMQEMLARHGAARIGVDYDQSEQGSRGPVGLSFTLHTPHGPRHFTLPVDVEAMRTLLVAEDRAGRLKGGGAKARRTSRKQAERVAWRVIKDWLAAQLTLVDARMASLDQVMLPYLVVEPHSGHTLYERYREQETLALPGPQE